MPITESAVRSQLARKGYMLRKSRKRDEEHPSFGCFWILDPFANFVVAGSGPFGPDLDLEDAAEWTNDLADNRPQ